MADQYYVSPGANGSLMNVTDRIEAERKLIVGVRDWLKEMTESYSVGPLTHNEAVHLLESCKKLMPYPDTIEENHGDKQDRGRGGDHSSSPG